MIILRGFGLVSNLAVLVAFVSVDLPLLLLIVTIAGILLHQLKRHLACVANGAICADLDLEACLDGILGTFYYQTVARSAASQALRRLTAAGVPFRSLVAALQPQVNVHAKLGVYRI